MCTYIFGFSPSSTLRDLFAKAKRLREGSDNKAFHDCLCAIHDRLVAQQTRAPQPNDPLEPRVYDLKGRAFTVAHKQFVRLMERKVRVRQFTALIERAAVIGRRRRMLIAEIVSTETTYVSGLNTIISVFLQVYLVVFLYKKFGKT